MSKLIFDAAELKVLCDHAKSCKTHAAGYAHLTEAKYLKDGASIPPSGWAEAKDIDNAKIPAHLVLVKDQGCYLMSSGLPRLPGVETLNLVAYAKGLGPDADYDDLRRACGGNDFGENLPLGMFEQALVSGSETITINMTASRISVEWQDPTKAREPNAGRRKNGPDLSM